jgi:hypothetical protein
MLLGGNFVGALILSSLVVVLLRGPYGVPAALFVGGCKPPLVHPCAVGITVGPLHNITGYCNSDAHLICSGPLFMPCSVRGHWF